MLTRKCLTCSDTADVIGGNISTSCI